MNILVTLITIQKHLQLKDAQFADKLGIHRVSWQRIKNGRVPISDKFLVRVNRAFPELGVFLFENTRSSPITAQNTDEKPQNRNIATLVSNLMVVAYQKLKGFLR